MDPHEVYDAIRLVFHSDIPDALLRDVIEKAVRDHSEQLESRVDEMEARRMSATAKEGSAKTPGGHSQGAGKG